MSKTTTSTEYAALAKQPDGSWYKLHPFFCRSEEEAKRILQAHYKRIGENLDEIDYKIMTRTVTVTVGEWRRLPEKKGE
jgi:hypothetical protein